MLYRWRHLTCEACVHWQGQEGDETAECHHPLSWRGIEYTDGSFVGFLRSYRYAMGCKMHTLKEGN